jgi:hypothetical protein
LRRGFTSFAFFSLASANPKDTPALIDKAAEEIEAIKKSCTNPGLAEQLNLQLERLSNKELPDLELIGMFNFPAMSAKAHSRWQGKHISVMMRKLSPKVPVTPDPEKKYLAVSFTLNHPLSRGTIVSCTFL